MAALNLMEFEGLAQEKLLPMVYGYYASGSDDQVTLRNNRDAFNRISLAQNYNLRGIPTLIRFENGVEQARIAGQISLENFRDFVLQA